MVPPVFPLPTKAPEKRQAYIEKTNAPDGPGRDVGMLSGRNG